jgi:ribosomal protein S18 acetylase RimI-like enzyme
MVEIRVERASRDDSDAISYLETQLVRNALDIWNLSHEASEYVLYIGRIANRPLAHLGVYSTPEANYVDLGGIEEAAEPLLGLIPSKAVLTVTPELGSLVRRKLRVDAVYSNDIMVAKRGGERLHHPEMAQRISRDFASEYSNFGSSFNAPRVPIDWIYKRLDEDMVFGVFLENKLVSVASLVAWLPQVAMILGVETKKAFRRRGFGASVVSAALQEALSRSETCGLFVRSDNAEAIGLYQELGFAKAGEELWIDIGTGMVP